MEEIGLTLEEDEENEMASKGKGEMAKNLQEIAGMAVEYDL